MKLFTPRKGACIITFARTHEPRCQVRGWFIIGLGSVPTDSQGELPWPKAKNRARHTFGTWPILLALAGVVLVALIVVFLILRVRNRDWKSPGEDVAAPSATQAVSTTALPVVPPQATLTTAGFPAEEDFVVVSGPASPRVAYAMVHGPGKLSLVLDVAMPKGAQPGTAVAVGLAAVHKVVLTEHDAQVHPLRSRRALHLHDFPAGTIATEADWGRLRMALP